MRTTLDLPDPLFRELKARSALRGVLLKDFVAEILQTGLAQTTAALAASAGARVVSFDSDFTAFPDLDFLHLRP